MTKTIIENNAREALIAIRLDWINNYLTLAKFAEDNGLTESEAEQLIELARVVALHNNPEFFTNL